MNLFKSYKKAGFTLVEGLIVIGILGLIILGSFVATRGKQQKVILNDAKATIVRALEKARSNAETGVGTGNHGIRINGNTITLLRDCGSPCADDFSMQLPAAICVDFLDSGGDNQIVFDRLSAQTIDEETAEIRVSNCFDSSSETIIEILSNGIISL